MAKLIMTVDEAKDREKWLALRQKGIGGSDISAILGMNKYKSAFALWLEKTGQAEAEDLSDNERVYWGTVLEDAVANRFSELTGKKLRRCGTLADEEYPFLHANVDRLVVGENAGLECKTTGAFGGKAWDGDEIPDAYYLQVQFYLLVTGYEKWYIACLIGGNKFVWKEVLRNEEDIKAIKEAAIDFWRMVEMDIMPAVDGSPTCADALQERFKAKEGLETPLPSAAVDEIEKLKEVKEMLNQLNEQKTLSENRLKAMLGEAEVGIIGENKVKWSLVAGRVSVDAKRLKAELPDVYEKYTKVSAPSRRFSVQ